MDPQNDNSNNPQTNPFQTANQKPPVPTTNTGINTPQQSPPPQQPPAENTVGQHGGSVTSTPIQSPNMGSTTTQSPQPTTNNPTVGNQPGLPNQFNQPPQAPHESLQQSPTSGGKKKRRKIIAIVTIVLVLLLAGGTLAFGALVAYGQIDLKNNALERRIAGMIFQLPFFDPSPEFLLIATSEAHEEVTSFAYNSSVAFELEGLEDNATNPLTALELMSPENPFDFSSFELSSEGMLDYTDEDNPLTQTTVNIANIFAAEMRTVDQTLYFKVDKLPTFLTTLFVGYGFDIDPFLNSWVSYPIEELNTEADAMIQARKDTEVDTSEYEKFIEVMRSDVLQKVEVSNGNDSAENTYKLHVTLTDAELKSISRKLSGESGLDSYLDTTTDQTIIDKFEVNLWIHESDFLIRKMEVYAVLKEAGSIDPATTDVLGTTFGLTQADDLTMRMAVTMNLTDYGKKFDIKAPENSETIEEFVARMTESFSTLETSGYAPPAIPSLNPTSQLDKTRDAGRISITTQLGFATEAFFTSKQTYPSNTNFWIQELVSAGEISSVPEGVEYSTSLPCTKSVVKNSWCYETDPGKTSFITYSRLEKNDDCANPTQNAWFVYSSTDGRGGTVCQDTEPSVGPQTFVE